MSELIRERALANGSSSSALRVYAVTRGFIRRVLHPLFRVEIRNAERLDITGPLLLAPVHRSHLDSPLVAAFSRRRIRALAKESLFSNRQIGWFLASLGAFPVRRGEADRDALLAAMKLLDQGEAMIVFPEGTRQRGREIGELFDGAAYLAGKTGATVLPIGVAGTEDAMPAGATMPRRSSVAIVVGEPMRIDGAPRRVSKAERQDFTADLESKLQLAMDEAHELLAD